MAQSGAVGAAVLVDPGQCLRQDREVPGQQRRPQPDGLDRSVFGREMAQGRAELGLADPVLDVGTAPTPRFHVADRLNLVAVVADRVGDDERDRVRMRRGALQGQGELVGGDGAPPTRAGHTVWVVDAGAGFGSGDGERDGRGCLFDNLMARVDSSELRLTGEGGFLPEMIKAVLERGLRAELSDHLGYEKGDPAGRGSPNSRNGTTPKTVATEVGGVSLDGPRDRDGSFEPRLVPKGARRVGGLDEMIISLYAGGMTVRDIGHHLARTIGTELSHERISNITDAVLDEVKSWQSRPLEEIYPIVYLDALVVKVRDGHQVKNRAAHIAVGGRPGRRQTRPGDLGAGHRGREVLGRGLRRVRNRGVRDVLIVCCDGPTGFPEAIESTWPQAVVQTCVVHLIRAASRYAASRHADKSPHGLTLPCRPFRLTGLATPVAYPSTCSRPPSPARRLRW